MTGTFSGTPGPLSWTDSIAGVNMPATRLPNGGFEWESFTSSAANNAWFNIVYYKQYLLLGATQRYNDLTFPVLTPDDAMAIDVKVDDGLPSTGVITASSNWYGANNCTVGNLGGAYSARGTCNHYVRCSFW